MSDRHRICLTVNGVEHDLDVDARRTLADALRHDLGMSGTHVGCEHGICGACTVLVDGEPMRSCLAFAVQLPGRSIETVEGLAAADGSPGDLQQAFARHQALQCGFCTPGFLMLAAGYLRRAPTADADEVREFASANLCRCTGYDGIVSAIQEVAGAWDAGPLEAPPSPEPRAPCARTAPDEI